MLLAALAAYACHAINLITLIRPSVGQLQTKTFSPYYIPSQLDIEKLLRNSF